MRVLGIIATLCFATRLASAGVVQSMADIAFWVGSGSNQAVLIIDWQDGKNIAGGISGQALAWGYRWEPTQTRTGMDMILAVAAADPRLEVKTVTRALGLSVFGIYHDLDGDGGPFVFDPLEELGFASDADDHFREGWRFNGFWGYRLGATNTVTLPAWNVAGGGAASRPLTNNSWDAWVFSEDLVAFTIPQPVGALAVPVPEPRSCLLLALGAAILRRRR